MGQTCYIRNQQKDTSIVVTQPMCQTQTKQQCPKMPDGNFHYIRARQQTELESMDLDEDFPHNPNSFLHFPNHHVNIPVIFEEMRSQSSISSRLPYSAKRIGQIQFHAGVKQTKQEMLNILEKRQRVLSNNSTDSNDQMVHRKLIASNREGRQEEYIKRRTSQKKTSRVHREPPKLVQSQHRTKSAQPLISSGEYLHRSLSNSPRKMRPPQIIQLQCLQSEKAFTIIPQRTMKEQSFSFGKSSRTIQDDQVLSSSYKSPGSQRGILKKNSRASSLNSDGSGSRRVVRFHINGKKY